MDTKELILEKTLKLMIEKQSSMVSIREIRDATGVDTGGIYYYFSSKDEIYNEITEKYFISYIKFDMDKLRKINENTKDKIHNVLAEMLTQKPSSIRIESVDDEIDYRIILEILTAHGFAYENSMNIYMDTLKEFKEFLTEIIEEGQKNREIRQDLSSTDLAESLLIMNMGIHYKWEVYLIDDMLSVFEDNFDLEWEKIRFKE